MFIFEFDFIFLKFFPFINFFLNCSEKNEVEKFEKDYDQMFVKSNKMVLYDEEEKSNMKDSLDFLKIDKLDMMFPKNFIDDIQNFAIPKLEFQTVDI